MTETRFNYCKTNTKFLEYIQAGIPVLASNFGPYENTPSIDDNLDHGHVSWVEKVEIALLSKSRRGFLYDRQLQYCSQFSDASLLVKFYREISK